MQRALLRRFHARPEQVRPQHGHVTVVRHLDDVTTAATARFAHDARAVAKLVHLIVNTHTHTHPFNGLFSGTTRVSQYQKGKTNVDFTGARDSEWQWHQLGRMQVCTSLQTDNHAHHSVFTGQMPFLPLNLQRQSTEGILIVK